jgi:hypothetical protein
LVQTLSYVTDEEDAVNQLGRDRNFMQIRWSKTGCRGYEITNLEGKSKSNTKEDFEPSTSSFKRRKAAD